MVSRFIAKRLYGSNDGQDDGCQKGCKNGYNNSYKKGGSPAAVVIATVGIALGIFVMIVSIAVTSGFKNRIMEKVAGFTGDIQIDNYYSALGAEDQPVTYTDSLLNALAALPGIKGVSRYIDKPGIMKTDSTFQGFVLKGIGADYGMDFFQSHVVEGTMPQLSDSVASQEVLVSRELANRMELSVGDRVDVYFVQNQVRARRLTVSGIYETGFSEYDKIYAVTDIRTLQRINMWAADEVLGIQAATWNREDFDSYVAVKQVMGEYGNRIDETYAVRTARQLNSGLFGWLDVLNVNVIVILVLMLGIAGFTMISGLLIIIFERTRTIGILKALGADNMTIRKVFLHLASYIVVRGMVIGNVAGIALCLIQEKTGFIPLDAQNYYLSQVPMELGLWWLIILNITMFVLSMLMLIGPSAVIARINPSATIRFE